MQPTTFLSEGCTFDDEVPYRDHVAQFKQLWRNSSGLVQSFRLIVQQVDAFHCTLEAYIITHNSHIVTHHLLQFFETLCDEDHFLWLRGSACIPVGNSGEFFHP